MTNSQSKTKVVLITGASSGVGKCTADKLLDEGYTVYAASRRVNKMEDLAKNGASVLKEAMIYLRGSRFGL